MSRKFELMQCPVQEIWSVVQVTACVIYIAGFFQAVPPLLRNPKARSRITSEEFFCSSIIWESGEAVEMIMYGEDVGTITCTMRLFRQRPIVFYLIVGIVPGHPSPAHYYETATFRQARESVRESSETRYAIRGFILQIKRTFYLPIPFKACGHIEI
ncbi:hypothetical protein F5Y14DRAFT_420623 [Nemania sp. NC0429]|nr:hypothetical protein F5Y14DRAFT_420623 [Nemania sp. NC0429]